MPNEPTSNDQSTDPVDSSSTNDAPNTTIPNAPPAEPATPPVETAEGGGTGEGGSEASFDHAELERQFGLTAGSLKDYASAEEATAAVRSAVDQMFVSSVMDDGGEPPTPNPAQPPVTPPAEQAGQPKPGQQNDAAANSIAALAERVKGLEAQLEQANKAQAEATRSEVTRVAQATIDGWNSPTYGNSKSRTFKQAGQLRTLLQHVKQHTDDLRRSGAQVPPTEQLLNRLRLWHDEAYQPSSAAQEQPGDMLNRPGNVSAAASNNNAPASIHDAVIGAWKGR